MPPRRRDTGSRLLGRELRRLRGSRTLDQIVAMSQSRAASGPFRSISKGCLSDIENGLRLPTLESLVLLAAMYDVSPSHLTNLLVQEQLIAGRELPATAAEIEPLVLDALRHGRWAEALALAIQGEEICDDETDRVKWRAHRARAMRNLGMRRDAIIELMECVENPAISDTGRWQFHWELANALASAGLVRAASHHARTAERLAPEHLSAEKRRGLSAAIVHVSVQWHEFGFTRDEVLLHDGLHRLDVLEAEESRDTQLLTFGIYRAVLLRHLGRHREAHVRLEAVRERAMAVGAELQGLFATLQEGCACKAEGLAAEAVRWFEVADADATRLQQHALAFHACFELHGLAVARRDAAAIKRFTRRCDRLLPLLESRTPQVVAWERMQATRGGRR